MTDNNHYEVTAPTGRVWTLQPIPKHFLLYYGQLPTFLTATASDGMNKAADGEQTVEQIVKKMTPKEQMETAIFVKEAVQFACVKPKISMHPASDDEISPFSITEAEFEFLSQTVMQNLGKGAQKKS